MKSFKDKVVVITGGATGIGFALAKKLGSEGARIVIAARRKERLEEAVEKLAGFGIDASYAVCDVSKRKDVEALADFAWDRYGQVDAIINNAGISEFNQVIGGDEDQIRRVLDINVMGAWYGISVFGERFIKAGTPAGIYSVGSENSLFVGFPQGSAYIASKHALLAVMDSLRKEVPENISVGLICPGFVHSEIGKDMSAGMDTDHYASVVVEQMKAEKFYIVSHAYNMVHIDKRHHEISEAYEAYAPRYEGDSEHDVWTQFNQITGLKNQ